MIFLPDRFLKQIALCVFALYLLGLPTGRAEDFADKAPDIRMFDYLSFAGSEQGGLVRLVLDAANGRIVSQQEIFQDTVSPVFHYLQQTADGRFLAFTNLHDEASWIFVLRRDGSELKARRVDFGERGMFLALTDKNVAVAGNKGSVFLVDLESATVRMSANISNTLSPRAHQFGGIQYSPDQKRLAVLCMTDSPQGNRFGGRVVILDANSLAVLHDLKLPALYPQLHYGTGSKHNNPVPVGLTIGPQSGTAAIVLENYGGLLLVPAAKLFNGDLSDSVFIPTSKSGLPGEGFPTKAIFFEYNGHEYLLGDSASDVGGLTLIDPVKKERLGWIASSPKSIGGFGVLAGQRAYAFSSGIQATRGENETLVTHTESPDLLLVNLSPIDNGELPTVEVISFNDFLYFAHALNDAERRFLVLASMSKGDERELKLGLYDTTTRKLTDQQKAKGVLRGFVPVPTRP